MDFPIRKDRTRELFHHNWTRSKRMSSQVNGQTEMSQNTIILLTNAKAHRR